MISTRITAAIMCILLALVCVSGCTNNNRAPQNSTPAPQTQKPVIEDTPEPDETEDQDRLRLGMAILTDTGDSTSASGDDNGVLKADATVVAVMLDSSGRIVNCFIDGVQAVASFTSEGKLEANESESFSTKRELGEDYGMAKASPIGREWYSQVDAFEAYVTGKTLDEVKSIAVSEAGRAEYDELAAGCTISITGFVSGIEKAASNAKESTGVRGDRLGVGTITNVSNSEETASGGTAEAYSTYAACCVDESGKITDCIIDAVQASVDFDASGAIPADVSAAVPTKNELGESYGMRPASGIGREWYEQAAAFASYITGRSADELAAMELNSGVPADADIASSVTVHVTDFIAAAIKACAAAK